MRPLLAICFWLLAVAPSPAQLIINGNGTGGFGIQHPGYISNNWYMLSYPGLVGQGGASPGTNVVVCGAAYIPTPVTIKTLGASVTNVQSSSHLSMAIYTNVGARPGTLIDNSATTLASVGGTVTGSLANTTDALTSGIYWACYAFDADNPALQSVGTSAYTSAWLLGSTTLTKVAHITTNMTAIKCAVSATTCGGTGSGWAGWSGTTFTWGDATSATWTDVTDSIGSLIEMQVN